MRIFYNIIFRLYYLNHDGIVKETDQKRGLDSFESIQITRQWSPPHPKFWSKSYFFFF